mmetsp:Transcript_24336/g.55503  ORF Transcript_24336/g.55503 Transcript_24336/m.55503 type:complete len:183 (-) Transcript_24336:134-682(-)
MSYLMMLTCLLIGTGGGYLCGVTPGGSWSFFSWHPFLMMVSYISLMGMGALTKKLGGYKNTKMHGILSSVAVACAGGGYWVIYKNKENYGRPHLMTLHGKAGFGVLLGSVGAMLFGAIFLHPDFGTDKTNKTIRKFHKIFGRSMIAASYVVCILGLRTLTTNVWYSATLIASLLMLTPNVLF